MKTETAHKIGKTLVSTQFGKRTYYLISKLISKVLADKQFLQITYLLRVGKKLNLKNPKTFTEKIQWLKLYYQTPLLIKMADKAEVRNYVKEKIGSKILIPLIGVYDSFKEINLNKLVENK